MGGRIRGLPQLMLAIPTSAILFFYLQTAASFAPNKKGAREVSKGDREKKNEKFFFKEKLEIHLGYSLLEII